MAYSEKEFVIPTLEFLRDNPQGKTTTEIITYLREKLQPEGDDLTILSGRKDDKFSQKVRNLKAHDTLRNFATYIKERGQQSGIFKINEKGKEFLKDKRVYYDSLDFQGFSVKTLKEEVEKDFKDLVIEEGNVIIRNMKVKQRSDRLRNAKIQDFKHKNNGKVFCEICNFNFFEKYGSIGKDVIVVHHTKPIHLKSDDGERQSIKEALKDVACVCPNCHLIIHKDRDNMLSFKEMKEII